MLCRCLGAAESDSARRKQMWRRGERGGGEGGRREEGRGGEGRRGRKGDWEGQGKERKGKRKEKAEGIIKFVHMTESTIALPSGLPTQRLSPAMHNDKTCAGRTAGGNGQCGDTMRLQ